MMRLLKGLSTVALAVVFAGGALTASSLQEQVQDKVQKAKKEQKPSGQSSQTPSLAELAARTKAERSGRSGESVVVFDNGSLRRSGGGRVGHTTVPKPETPAEGAEGASEGETEEATALDEQLTAVQQELTAAKLQYVTAVNGSQVIQLSLNALRDRFLQASDAAAQEKFQSDMAAKLAELSDNDARIIQLGQDLDDLRKKAAGLGMEKAAIEKLIGELPKPLKIPGLEPDSE